MKNNVNINMEQWKKKVMNSLEGMERATPPEDLYDMYSTNFPHFGLEDYRKIYEDYRMFWVEDEEDMDEKTLDYGKR